MNFGGDEDDKGTENIEDTILDEVKAVTGDNFNEDDEEDAPEEPAEEEAAVEQPPAPEAARSRKDNPRQRGDSGEVQRWINAKRHVDYNYNEKGDVVDKAGNVLFAKGTPARDLFAAVKNEQFERSKVLEQGQNLFRAYNEQQQKLGQYEAAFKATADSGLNMQDQVIAMEHMKAFRANPTQALRKMLTDFQVDGGDLSEIFEDLPKLQLEGLEARLKQLADGVDKPSREKAAEEQRQQELLDNANREVTSFFGENPEAEMHSDTLAHIINSAAQKGQVVSLASAWTRLLRFCNQKGLSIDQPLNAQLSDEPQQQQRRQAPPQRPLPGRGRSNGLSPSKSATPAYEKRNRDFVREAMEEAGITFDS